MFFYYASSLIYLASIILRMISFDIFHFLIYSSSTIITKLKLFPPKLQWPCVCQFQQMLWILMLFKLLDNLAKTEDSHILELFSHLISINKNLIIPLTSLLFALFTFPHFKVVFTLSLHYN